MNWHEFIRERLGKITGDAARDADIVEELAQHLASRFGELRSAGATEQEAISRIESELPAEMALAIRRADRLRPASPVPPASSASRLVSDFWNDARYALRSLGRKPGFTMASLVTLALGIGMTTAIFSALQAVLLRPVPFPEPERLVMMWETDRNSGTMREPASMPDFVDYRQLSRQVDRLGAFVSVDLNLVPDRGDPRRLSALAATSELLDLLGVKTIAGRLFTAEEVRPRGPRVVIISDRLWEQLFTRDPSAIGAVIRLNDMQWTIIGVLSPTADFGVLQILSAAAYARGFADRDPRTRVDVWAPLQTDPATAPRGGNHSYIMVGRLAGGATVASAHDEMVRIAADLERTYPQDNAGRGRGATDGRDGRIVRSTLIVAEVAFAFVLVTGAGLLIRTFWNLIQTDPGFDVTGVLKAEFQASPSRYPTGPKAGPHFVEDNRFTDSLLQRVSRLPGVESAALAANHPFDTGFTNSFRVVGREAEAANWPEISCRFVTPGYFRTLRVPLVHGRFLSDSDTSSSEGVVMVNQATAERFFPNQDPVGQKIGFWGVQWTIVGIVGNERFQGIAKAAPIGAYAPMAQTRFTTMALI